MNNCFGSLRLSAGLVLLAASSGCIAGATAETVDGYVTVIESPTDFYLSTLHVVADGNTRCDAETLDTTFPGRSDANYLMDVYQHFFSLQEAPNAKSRKAVSCSDERLRVGSRVRATGDLAHTGTRFVAKQETVFDVHIGPAFTAEWPHQEWKGRALFEEQPQVTRTKQGWSGTLWLDGYPMAISPYTTLLTAATGTGTGCLRCIPVSKPLFRPNIWIAYRAAGPLAGKIIGKDKSRVLVRHVDRNAALFRNQVLATRMRLRPNSTNKKETKYLLRLNPLIRAPNYTSRISGSIGFEGDPPDKNLKILPDEEIQKYVSDVGRSLIPEYQKALAQKDETQVRFRFYVVQGGRPAKDDDEMCQGEGLLVLSRKGSHGGVAAFPNGVIVLADYMLARIRNDAQLASMLSTAITSILQKQGFLTDPSANLLPYIPYNGPGTGEGGLQNPVVSNLLSFELLRNEQAIRIGIRQMYLAGYDIREAPFAWAVAAGRPAMNPVTAPDRVSAKVPWHAAYAFDYIRQFYSGVDYSKLKRGEREYGQFLDELRRADPDAFAEKRGVQSGAAQIP